ncbi:superoxide dismutase [Rhizobium sp. WW_1]|jgi:Fe-Mn family superoxide dismutase|uniref:superoxide dismutase n=1 Tax=Rhizobium sp. WW_1 TaxID=1907375 RepID=UPI000647C103|nr:superoxide dismutase [Rhizobium sp. WW_1]RKD68009.1 Fe-Mn family superoxide dismutase [Rhizobium sp. WW_1]
MFNLTRRHMIAAAAGVVATIATTRISTAQQQTAVAAGSDGPFKLPPLPYGYDALQAAIDTETMHLHHDKHHAAYVANLNAAAKEAPQIADHPMERLLANLDQVPDNLRTTVRNNLGGHVNHSMFWEIMGGTGAAPGDEVAAAIQRDFGGLDQLKTAFNAAGGKVFGSGWVFVTVTPEGKLALETRPNQDTPLMEGKRVLFGNDVWEHSYYLRYQNRRPDYLSTWWTVINWPKIGERYVVAREGKLTI